MAEVARVLELTPAYVKGVVTFYTMYHQHPVGKHFIQVCTTSPCNVCGAEDVVEALPRAHRLRGARRHLADGKFTVIEVECLGACGFATPIMINEDFIESVTPEKVSRRILAEVLGKWDIRTRRIRARRRCSRSTSATPRRARSTAGEKRGGYVALEKALGMTPAESSNVVKDSGLRGRGGAGFPTA